MVDESGASDDEHYYSSVASDSDTEPKANQPPAVTVQVKDVFKPPTQLPRVSKPSHTVPLFHT